jgi:hypothetical protein
MSDSSKGRPRWLAPPGQWRRAQMTIILLLVFVAIGIVVAWAAYAAGATSDAWKIGVAGAVLAELIGFLVPVRVASSRRFRLPATPEQIFAVTRDPLAMQRLSPLNMNLRSTGGEAGAIGSTYQATSSGLTMHTRVVEADPPHRIVTETRSLLNRVRVVRSYSNVPGGTVVHISTTHRMPLVAWLLRPVYRREVEYVLSESERRIRTYFSDAVQSGGGGVEPGN